MYKSYPKPRLASHPSFFPIPDLLVLPRFRMLDQTGSSTIAELPLHITIPALELLLVEILRPVSHQIPIHILLTKSPCVPVNQLLGTVARRFAKETTFETKIFLSNVWVIHSWAMLTSRINITTQEVQSTLSVYFIWILYFICIGLFSPIITIRL